MILTSSKYHPLYLMALLVCMVVVSLESTITWPAILLAMLLGFLSRDMYKKIVTSYVHWRYHELVLIADPRYPDMTFYAGVAQAYRETIVPGIWDCVDYSAKTACLEYIMRAAIQHPSGVIFCVINPGRHHHVISAMASVYCSDIHGVGNTRRQGFITSRGRFVCRFEGLIIANVAKQIKVKHDSVNELYSEDMW